MKISIGKAIELIGELIYYQYSASESETGEAMKMSIVALNEKKERLELDCSASKKELNAVGGGGKAIACHLSLD